MIAAVRWLDDRHHQGAGVGESGRAAPTYSAGPTTTKSSSAPTAALASSAAKLTRPASTSAAAGRERHPGSARRSPRTLGPTATRDGPGPRSGPRARTVTRRRARMTASNPAAETVTTVRKSTGSRQRGTGIEHQGERAEQQGRGEPRTLGTGLATRWPPAPCRGPARARSGRSQQRQTRAPLGRAAPNRGHQTARGPPAGDRELRGEDIMASDPRPLSRARMMAAARSATSSLAKMLVRWLLTVLGERNSVSAMAAVRRPRRAGRGCRAPAR